MIPAPASRLDGVRWRVATTPGRLRLLAALVAIAVVAFGVVTGAAALSRHRAARGIAAETEPLLVEADGLYASLSDADATATTTFLTGGIEPTARRRRYLHDLRVSTAQLAALTRQVGGSALQRDVQTIAGQLPVYAGLV